METLEDIYITIYLHKEHFLALPHSRPTLSQRISRSQNELKFHQLSYLLSKTILGLYLLSPNKSNYFSVCSFKSARFPFIQSCKQIFSDPTGMCTLIPGAQTKVGFYSEPPFPTDKFPIQPLLITVLDQQKSTWLVYFPSPTMGPLAASPRWMMIWDQTDRCMIGKRMNSSEKDFIANCLQTRTADQR